MTNINPARVLELMQCPVCYDVLHPPIYLCDNGHAVCGDCLQRMEAATSASAKCPLCRAEFQSESNQLLEIIYDRIEVPCKNSSDGCEVVCYGSLMRGHQYTCIYRTTRCPRGDQNCRWEGPLTMLTKHVIENHTP